jgi:polysaccharide export outer membrane protein
MIDRAAPCIALVFFLAGLVSCAKSSMQASLTSADGSADRFLSEDYQIGPEDVLEVLVWKNDALSKTVNVRPDGKISLPLIGDVAAAGLSPGQVREQILEKLQEYYKEPPPVSVIVQQAKSYVIYILGEVKNPAQYVVKRGTTILQAVALAGGFTPFASTNGIVVLRRENNNNDQSRIKIRYKDIISGSDLSSNIILKPGDTIIVP